MSQIKIKNMTKGKKVKSTYERKPISDKIRFEVFKRNNFTCSYCGRKAPEFILNVDHIHPVSKGGDNNMLNLTTSCSGCNGGKSNRLLSDNSVFEKQIEKLAELNERKIQLDMMIEWRNELNEIQNMEINKVIDYFNKKSHIPCNIRENDDSILLIMKTVKKFGAIETIDAIDAGFNVYIGNSIESIEMIISKVYAIADISRKPENERKKIYVFNLCKKIYEDFDPKQHSIVMKKCFDANIDLDSLLKKIKGKEFKKWVDVLNEMNNFLIK